MVSRLTAAAPKSADAFAAGPVVGSIFTSESAPVVATLGGTAGDGADFSSSDMPRLPNIHLARFLSQKRQERHPVLLRGLLSVSPGKQFCKRAYAFRYFRLGLNLDQHLAVIRSRTEEMGLKRNDDTRFYVERRRKLLHGDFRALGNACLIDDELRRRVVRPISVQEIDDVFRVAKRREIRSRHDDILVGSKKRLPGPIRPRMRQVDNNTRRAGTHLIDDLFNCRTFGLVHLIDHCRSGEEREMFAALDQQAIQ